MKELRECPLCSEYLVYDNKYYKHPYNKCILTGREFHVEEVAKWNTRHDGWISVNDRLPKAECRYLTYQHGTGEITDMDFYLPPNDIGWGARLWEYEHEKVTHWMPLPAPPSPKGVEG